MATFDTDEKIMAEAEYARHLISETVATTMALLSIRAEQQYPDDRRRQAALLGASAQMYMNMIAVAARGLQPALAHLEIRHKFHEAVDRGFDGRGDARPE